MSDSGVSSTDNITNDNTPTFNITCTSGATIDLREGGNTRATGTCLGDGTITLTSASLSDGNKNFSARQTIGMTVTSSSTLSVTIDTNAPSTPGTPNMTSGTDTGVSNNDNITNDNTPNFTMTCGLGSNLVTIFTNGVPSGSANCSLFFATVTSDILNDGTQTITAQQSDTAGNLSGFSSGLSVTIDTIAPGTPGIPDMEAASDLGDSDSDDLTSDNTPSFSVACENNEIVELLDGGSQVGSTTCPVEGFVSVTSSVLSDGLHDMGARQSDVAGNSSATSDTLAVTIDTTEPAPGVPDLQTAQDTGVSSTDNLTNIDSPTFDISCITGNDVDLLEGATVLASGPCVNSLASIQSPALSDGLHSLSAQQTDPAGNVSAASASLVVTIDTGSPTAPGTPDLFSVDSGSSSTDNYTNDTTPTFRVACTTGTVYVFHQTSIVLGSATCSGGFANITTTPALTEDATYSVQAYQVDAAGNFSQNSGSLTFYLDTVAPATPGAPDLTSGTDTGESDSDDLTKDNTPEFTGTCEVAENTNFPNTVELVEGSTVLGSATCVEGDFSITSIQLGEGEHIVFTRSYDPAGNLSGNSETLTIDVDTTKPTTPSNEDLVAASDTGDSDTDNLTKDTTPTFTATCTEEGNKVTLFANGEVVGDGTCGMGAVEITASALPEGTYTIKFSETDSAGNESDQSAGLSIEIDTTAPDATTTPDLIDSSDSNVNNDNNTNDNTPTFSIGCVTGRPVTLYVGETADGTGACVGGWVSLTATTLPDGVYNITATQTDVAGNVSAPPTALSVVIDTLNPLAPVIQSPEANELVETSTPTISGTAESGLIESGGTSTVEVFIDSNSIGSTNVTNGGTWSIVSPAIDEGGHSVFARVTDIAGNVGTTSSSVAFSVDTDDDLDGILNSQEGGTDDSNGNGSINRLDSSSLASTVLSNEYFVPLNGFFEQANIAEIKNNLTSEMIKVVPTVIDAGGVPHVGPDVFIAAKGQYDLPVNVLEGFAVNNVSTLKLQGFHLNGQPLSPGDYDGQLSVYRVLGAGFSSFDYAYAVTFSGAKLGALYAPYNTYQASWNPDDANNAVANWAQVTNYETSVTVSGNLVVYLESGSPLFVPKTLTPGKRDDISIHDLFKELELGAKHVGVVAWIPNSGFENTKVGLQVTRYYYGNSTFAVSSDDSFDGVISVVGEKGRSGPVLLPLDARSGTSAIGEISNVASVQAVITVKAYKKNGDLAETVSGTVDPKVTFHYIGDAFLAGDIGSLLVTSSVPGSIMATATHYTRLSNQSFTSARSLRGGDTLSASIAGSLNTFLSQTCRVLVSNAKSTSETVDMTRFDAAGSVIGSSQEITVPGNGTASADACQGLAANSYGRFIVAPRNSKARVAASALRSQPDYTMATEVRPF